MTEQGFELKRLEQVLTDLRSGAVPIFQDLVPPGDAIDVSASSTLGRMIALQSIPLADLWEAASQVYLAFDPNSAKGIALDNLVMYGGLTRERGSGTSATVVVWGNENLTIGANNTIRASNNFLFDVVVPITLNKDRAIGFAVTLSSVTTGTEYNISIDDDLTSFTVSYTALVGDTVADVIVELESQLSAYSSTISTRVAGDVLYVETTDIFNYIGFSVTNLTTVKIKNRTEVVCQVIGPIEIPANALNNIATPLFGWDSVTNPFPGVTGKDRETDEELRSRFRESKFIRAQNISDALYSTLLTLDGVRHVRIYENETDVYDGSLDLPPHSFKPIVLGGEAIDIANVIWINKPLGIKSVGNTLVEIIDSQRFTKDIYFQRPTSQRIYIDIEISITSTVYTSNVPQEIKAELIKYFEQNFTIGDDVIYSRLYTPINSIQGFQVNSLTVGTTASPTGTSNVVIAYDAIASLDAADITITIV